jgi:biotin carboxyl carrier protein
MLGSPVTAFDFPSFYDTLRSAPTVAGDPSRLLYDAEQIEAFTQRSAIASLRAEPARAALDGAINGRQNTYFARHANAAAIIDKMNQSYSPSAAGSKPDRLTRLRALAVDQAHELRAAYGDDGHTGVVRNTTSSIDSTITSSGKTLTFHDPVPDPGDGDDLIRRAFGDEPPPGLDTGDGEAVAALEVDAAPTKPAEEQKSTGSATDVQTVKTYDYAYRTPLFESQAQYERAQISLIDEEFAQFMYSQNLPNLKRVLDNELASLDLDVNRLQVTFLNTILLSPFPGVVTGVYKNPGDAVRPGEPVVRVENDEVMLLVATLVHPGRIAVGSTLTVKTKLFGAPGGATSVTAHVLAARGQREDDQWEIVAQLENRDTAGQPIFPLGYQFDYDDTQVSVA